MADEASSTKKRDFKPWGGNYEAERSWIIAIGDANDAAIEAGASKADIILALLSAAANIRGDGFAWELIKPITDAERAPIKS